MCYIRALRWCYFLLWRLNIYRSALAYQRCTRHKHLRRKSSAVIPFPSVLLSVLQKKKKNVRLHQTHRKIWKPVLQIHNILIRIRILLFTLIRIKILPFNLIWIRPFDTYPDLDPYHFKEVMYLTQYFLHNLS
jgi:hypothetical protein